IRIAGRASSPFRRCVEGFRKFARHDQGGLAHSRDLYACRGRRSRSKIQYGTFVTEAVPMNPNPFSDVVAFVTNPVWTTAVFWLLVLASVLIAAAVWRRLPEQRSFPTLVQWSIRFVMGA